MQDSFSPVQWHASKAVQKLVNQYKSFSSCSIAYMYDLCRDYTLCKSSDKLSATYQIQSLIFQIDVNDRYNGIINALFCINDVGKNKK